MTTDERRDRLRDLVKDRGFAALGELAEQLSVSESTIRRDLEMLEEAGLARRTHGGVYWTGESDTIGVFQSRNDDFWAAKQAIGRAAAELVSDHDTILLDGGSTVYELARLIVHRPLQVVTNSLPVAHLLSTSDSIDLVMIGGCVRGRTSVTIGPLADSQLATINVTTSFLSVAGVSPRGFFNSDMMLVESEKAMLASAERSIVLADHSKFGKTSLSRICELDEIDTVVTDDGLDSDAKAWLESSGVQLRLASTSSPPGTPKAAPTPNSSPTHSLNNANLT
ncbi:DeoR/GlpR family DNA-binding transcription regulator [Rhodopirellula halodulae]|uniref:DeoR/GlpR family DNA-binding transcription regulator n=1 Tax=Rhodopirellula halodulae TaxID=2894198 RepID=UPI001E653495|nr:DeoR/GlpR family DNA-binding transcription regulator [Rhodopirellula sp. JC737]MCC9656484.1 DeoR/GlpR family DNA-binding transcription regulator [Rhodopirellula sp. JC737]